MNHEVCEEQPGVFRIRNRGYGHFPTLTKVVFRKIFEIVRYAFIQIIIIPLFASRTLFDEMI